MNGLALLIAVATLWFGYWLGCRAGRETAMEHYKKPEGRQEGRLAAKRPQASFRSPIRTYLP